MRKLLMILYQFPPSGNVGAFRPIKFIRNLKYFGWYPVVLAPSNGVYSSLDFSLEDEIKDACTVYRVPLLAPLPFARNTASYQSKPILKCIWRVWNRLMLPDGAISWVLPAVRTGVKIVRRENIEVIFASGQPFSTFIIAWLIKKATGKKVILDYRDPWTLNPFYKGSVIRYKIESQLERLILEQSDKAIFTTKQMKEFQYKGFNKELDLEKLAVITNSFEGPISQKELAERHEKFVILHAGNLYGNRSPDMFFRGLSAAINSNGEFAAQVRVVFYGEFDLSKLNRMSHKFGVAPFVSFYPKIPKPEIFETMKKASLLLLINSYGAGHHIFIPAKFFDYLKIGKPIFCISEDGALRDIIEETRSGVVVSPRKPGHITQKLLGLFEQYHVKGEKFDPNYKMIAKYESLRTTQKLASLLDKL